MKPPNLKQGFRLQTGEKKHVQTSEVKIFYPDFASSYRLRETRRYQKCDFWVLCSAFIIRSKNGWEQIWTTFCELLTSLFSYYKNKVKTVWVTSSAQLAVPENTTYLSH